ncbi:MAG: chromate transporter [Flavobacteriaceae bacterium]|jgi:chromate transporter
MNTDNKLKEVGKLFFKLGCFAFGGPAAHIAMMEKEVVEKRKWMTSESFLDLISATNLIPGPNSTEMTMHCGYERAGKKGLFVAGIAFIFPAVFITGILAWFYVNYKEVPNVAPFIYGIKPAILPVIAGAVLKLGKKAIKDWQLALLAGLVVAGCLLGLNEILLLLSAGLIGASLFYGAKRLNSFTPIALLAGGTGITAKTGGVFLSFLKVGAILYGSGYVLLPYLKAELVDTGLLSLVELQDAIAMGQFTPGPVLSTATFVGFQLDGFWGAIAASIGIFLPSFIFVLLLNPLIPKMRKSVFLSLFLNSANAAAVAVMLAVLITMSLDTLLINDLFQWRALVIIIVCSIMTFKFKKISVMVTVLTGSVLGYLLYLI